MIFSKWFTSIKKQDDIEESIKMPSFNAIDHGKSLVAESLKWEEEKLVARINSLVKLQRFLALDERYIFTVVDRTMYITSDMTGNKIDIWYITDDFKGTDSSIGYDVRNITGRQIKSGFDRTVNDLCTDLYLYLSGEA